MSHTPPAYKIALLSSVCMLALAAPQAAEARRLMPELPSVEVHFEALEPLRYGTEAQGRYPGGWIQGPEGKIVSAPVGYPEPVQTPPPVQVAKKEPPAPPPAREVVKASAPAPPVEVAKEAPPLERLEPKAAPPAPPVNQEAAVLSLEQELRALPPLLAAPSAAPEVKKQPEKKEPEKKQEIVVEKTVIPVEPEKKIIIKAPKEEETASAPELQLPPLPGGEAGNEPLSLPPLPGEEALEPSPFKQEAGTPSVQKEAVESAPVEPASAADLLEPPGLPEAVPPSAAAEEEKSAPEKSESPAPEQEEEKGMFSGLKGMVTGLLGGDEEKKTLKPVAKISRPDAAPAPEDMQLPAPGEEGGNALPPPLPGEELASMPLPPLPDEEPAASAPPPVKDEANKADGKMPLPELPDFLENGKKEALPPLDAVTSTPGGDNEALDFVKQKSSGLTPLPPLPDVSGRKSKVLTVMQRPAGEAKNAEAAAKTGAAQEKEIEVASIPAPPLEKAVESSKQAAGGGAAPSVQILFAKTETEVPLASQKLLTELAKKLVVPGNSSTVSVMAFASGSEDQASIARRVSLSRALAIRAFLIDQGVDNLRINVQAMGNKDEGGNPERADVFVK